MRAVADGSAMLSPAVTRRLIESTTSGPERRLRAGRQALRRLAPLSEREREVLGLLGSGQSNAELAKRSSSARRR